MGLDAVEIVLRAEEFYATTVTDEEAAQVRTVVDFYQLFCAKLDVTPLSNPLTPAELHHPHPAPLPLTEAIAKRQRSTTDLPSREPPTERPPDRDLAVTHQILSSPQTA